ncbi:Hypothetical predicted protein [Olea europaea subsp. europaea]|uniref:Uncharacterized protein n=1 Tax=Olea europaea subsp. europaea TaxID=158383 RepID=A0A8S0VGX7_OLEEU|nr:Hypothetical predicted protein [Olea europaea subsp. europaea]
MLATTRRLTVLTKTWGLTGKRETVCALLRNTWSHARTSKTCHYPLEPKVCKAHGLFMSKLPCPDDHSVPVPTRTEEVQAEGDHQSSPDDHDEEQEILPTGTEYLQDTIDIEPCPDNDLCQYPLEPMKCKTEQEGQLPQRDDDRHDYSIRHLLPGLRT